MSDLVRRGAHVVRAPAASIVILVVNRVDRLSACLRSLDGLRGAPPHEVVVVGNGTPAAVLDSVPGSDRLVVVPVRANLGFAGGCNWGARFARGRHLVFLNDDTEVEPDWLRALVEVAETEPRVGVVGSLLLEPDGTVQEAGSILWSDAGTHQVGRGLAVGSAGLDGVRDVDYSSGCGLLVTRDAWHAVGGFDERYFPAYHEDVDLCLSARARGFRVVVAPQARVRHLRGGSLSGALREAVGARSGRLFRERWGGALGDFEPPPGDDGRDAAVAAAMARARARPLPPAQRAGPAPIPARAPTARELLDAELRAVGVAAEVGGELLGGLQADLAREREKSERLRAALDAQERLVGELRAELAREHARIAALQRLARRLHVPRSVLRRILGEPARGG